MIQNTESLSFKYTFSSGQTAYILDVPDSFTYNKTITALGLTQSSPSIVVIGGASKMSPESKMRVSLLFTKVLAPFAETSQVTVFDGGTDAGVIQMMGQARRNIGGTFQLVGITPKAKVNLPGYSINLNLELKSRELTALEENHTHFVLIPGSNWGNESPWLANCSSILAGNYPTITILINGGKISLSDFILNLSVGRQAIIIAGSGRLADEIANTINGIKPSKDPMIQNLTRTYYPNQLSVFDLTHSLDILTNRLQAYFKPQIT
ncbi:hypothetical protein [Leptothoe spongobia]|uniref:LSDAT prokaryote domain-containing protein n=1 Tax=Leptothoe spongobia TAU-MAC 1115 TaxID=1967444 RepID=A0A947DID4_9CYAN|nr:hypothetical protein [Leptothoe spongobia]MBT9317540.1 hypothetical protein [Leptothoe spongobia TAU-MAC 1115]